MYSKNNFLTTCKHRQAKFHRFLVICWFRQLFLFFAQFSSSSIILNRIQYCSCTKQLFTIYKKFSFLVVPMKNFWEQLNIGKVRPVFRTECSKRKFVFHQSKVIFEPVSAELICANDKHDSTINITSPEFFLPFAQTVYRPVYSCK